jgi:hypothetical protein
LGDVVDMFGGDAETAEELQERVELLERDERP